MRPLLTKILPLIIIFTLLILLTKEQDELLSFARKRNKNSNYKKIEADITKDGQLEYYELKKGQLRASQNNETLWQSPSEWWVEDFAIGSATQEEETDLIISFWRSGDFGPSKPFWVEENDKSIKQHLFVMRHIKGEFINIWGSSNLEQPNCSISIEKGNLITIEGSYQDYPNCQGQYTALWSWNGWGFSNEWREAIR